MPLFDREPIACASFEGRLADYLEGNVSAAAARDVESHLAACGDCRKAVEAARSVHGLFAPIRPPRGRGGLDIAVEPPMGFSRRVMLAIRAEEARLAAGRDLWRPLEALTWRLSWSAMVAAMAALFYLFGFQLSQSRPTVASQQTEVQELFPETAPQPASQDDALLTLAAARRDSAHGK